MENKKGISPTGIKLLGAIGALGAAAVLLVSGTLAWFTVSNTPTISKIKVNIGATQNFEIAKATDEGNTKPNEVTENDSDNEFAWGQIISFGDEGSEPIEINLPVKVDEDGEVKTVVFDENTGRTNGLTNDGIEESPMENGIAYYSYTVKTDDKTEEKKCGARMGFWLRTNTPGAISCEVGDISVSNDNFKRGALGIAVKIDKDGKWITLNPNDSTSLGDLAADSDGHYCEIMVYLNGDTSDDPEKGVVAMDVGGGEAISVEIDKIMFKNSNVNTDGQ